MDELMEELIPSENLNNAFFRFNEDEPIQFAVVESELVLRVVSSPEEPEPTVTFSDGKGNQFSIFLQKR